MNSAIGSYDFSVVAPAGYYIALRVGFAYPMSEQNALPARWVETYTEQGFMLFDPVMKWVYANTGTVRWSALKDDPQKILEKAARFGLRYGVAISCIDKSAHGQRSFGSFARTDARIYRRRNRHASAKPARPSYVDCAADKFDQGRA